MICVVSHHIISINNIISINQYHSVSINQYAYALTDLLKAHGDLKLSLRLVRESRCSRGLLVRMIRTESAPATISASGILSRGNSRMDVGWCG